MPDWSMLDGVMDFSTVYFTTQLMRCAVFSFILIWLVLLLRKVFFLKRVFLRGLLWISFLFIPFLGKLKLFYENKVVVRLTWKMTCVTMQNIWFDRIYIAGVFVTAICVFGKRLHLWKIVSGMKTSVFEGMQVCVTDMNVTPFTSGLLKPKIVLPQIMLDSYRKDELLAIIQHEKTHIRLGHLWYGFAWDLLICLLWINPFLSVFRKYLRSDMEDICDRVCIQNSGRSANEYGLILLKSLKVLRLGYEEISSTATYAGEKEFADMKRRMSEIADFRPYRKRLCRGMGIVTFMVMIAVFSFIHTNSYARYSESKDIMVGSYDGEAKIVSIDTEELSKMISYDDSYVYVDREAFEAFLYENNAEGDIYIIFGGYSKLPGLGGAGEGCIYERGSKDSMVRIPYESIMDNWVHVVCKQL
ncbi:MAG: M48 family metalloprotease [Lachnospiraceae bacterium]|nr:M48 family metalloprotease [Lachnospiraceae bacterium]